MSRSKKILELACAIKYDEDKPTTAVETSLTMETSGSEIIGPPVEVALGQVEDMDNQSIGLDIDNSNTLQLVGNELVVFDNQNSEVSRVQVELVCSLSENETIVSMPTLRNVDDQVEHITDSSCTDKVSFMHGLDVESGLTEDVGFNVSIDDVNISVENVNSADSVNDVSLGLGLMETTVDLIPSAIFRKRKKKEHSLSERKKMKIDNLKTKHSLKPPCSSDNCKQKCSLKINEERRKAINKMFWDLKSCDHRKSFIFNTCERVEVKRRTNNAGASGGTFDFRRNKTVKYLLTDVEDKKQQVCKIFFLTTLGFDKKNDKFVSTALSAEKGQISPKISMRGRQPAVNKGPHEEIITHIESFNPTIAHYRREHAPNTRYLPSDINISLMHLDFITKNPQFKNSVSYELYRRTLRSLKISFTRLGHEECETCEQFNLHGHSKDNLREDCEICSSWIKHDVLVKSSRKLYKAFAESSSDRSNGNEVVFSADLEKVIMIPRLEMFKSIIFAPRLTVFNQTFAPVGSKSVLKPATVLWHSAIRGRNQEDLVSAFYAFFKCYRDAKKIILWLDNCSAQNKNWCLLSFFVKVVNSSEFALTEIEVYYFEPGHTFMSADSVHHQIEKSLKAQKKTYDFEDFCKAVGNACKGKIEVVKMETSNFFEWKSFKSEHKMKKMPDRVYLSNIVQLKAVRGDLCIQYKSSYEESEEYKVLDFLQNNILKKGRFPEPQSVSGPQGFPQAKKSELLKILNGIIPENRKKFWEDLPVC